MHGLFTSYCSSESVNLSFLCPRARMEEPRIKYILLHDRVGYNHERNLLALGLTTKSTPTQVLRGELLEGVPETEQPQDSSKVAVVGIERKSLRLECPMVDMTRLHEEEANLLLAISSLEMRYNTFQDRKRLLFGRQLSPGSKVNVKMKVASKDLRGVVWYKGELPPHPGTWFGVQLLTPGQGTSDGTFRNRKYFECPKDSGVFVGLDKLTPLEDSPENQNVKRKGGTVQASVTSFIKESLPSFRKGKNEQKSSMEMTEHGLESGQRVVVFIEDKPAKGIVRYIGDENGKKIVGLEMEKRIGSGTGKRNRDQKFIVRRDYALFVPLEAVMPEKDFDEEAEQPPKKETEKQDLSAEQNHLYENELYAKSLGYLNVPSEKESSKKVRRANSFDAAEAEVILAAGESSKTDPKEFIEKQRQLFKEAQSSKQVETDKDDVVHMEVEYRTSNDSNLNFQENHFKNTPPNSTFRPITKQPGLSQVDFTEERGKKLHSDYTLIEKNNELSNNESRRDERCSVEAMQLEKGTVGHTIQFPAKEEVADSVAVATEEMEVDKLPEDSKETKEAQITELHSAADSQSVGSSQLMRDIPHGLEVGSMAEVPMSNVGLPRYGVVRWIGYLPEMKGKLVAGLELEEEQSPCSDGTFYGRRYFTCPAGRGFFVLVENCRPDSRFSNTPSKDKSFDAEKDFGSIPSPLIEGITEPPKTLEELHCGTMRGLQGHHNSCYLDATLYSMFSFSSVFDTLLHREKRDGDMEEYEKVQTVLRDLIVNPLRVTGFVRADRLLDLRHLLDKLSSTAGLVNEEKDPEEFLNSLLQQVLKADPFLHLKPRDVQEKNSEGAFLYQIITDKDENVKIAQVQTLLEQSFISVDLILSEVPSCLILQMPRFGNRYKMYDMILPNLELDVTHIVENVPRECTMCGSHVAQFECKKCYQKGLLADGPGIASYCENCNETLHKHRNRQDHKPKPILLPRVYSQYHDEKKSMGKQMLLDKQKMELFAVVCIETSHYVAFVKCGAGPKAPWCFFDSMADRKGERNGYNIPAVTPCPEAPEWLSKPPKEIIAAKERGEMPEKVRRLLGDGYLCMYQNLDMTMYK